MAFMLMARALREPREAQTETDQQIRDHRIQQAAINTLQSRSECSGEQEIIASSHLLNDTPDADLNRRWSSIR